MTNPMLGLAGFYQFEKRKVLGFHDDGEAILSDAEVVLPWFENLITNSGLDMPGTVSGSTNFLACCRLGTGNAAPAFTDTALAAQVGSSTTAGAGSAFGVSGDGTHMFKRSSFRFAAGSVSGVNLAEVAIAPIATGPVFSRALLKDTGGTPTTITLAPDEVLDVIYELRCYISNVDTVVNATVDGAACTVTMRPHGWPSSGHWEKSADALGAGFAVGYRGDVYGETQPPATTVEPSTSNMSAGVPASNAYVTGSYQRSYTFNFGLNTANFPTGIGMVALKGSDSQNASTGRTGIGCWSFGFNPKLNKNSERTATATVGFSWGRYTP